MKAIKLSVAAAAALALSTAAIASGHGPTVYGKQNVEVGSFESGATVGGAEVGAKTQASRFGIKGGHDLGGGLTGLYQIEIQHALIGGVADGGFGARNSFLGLTGDFGTVVVGNHDIPSKIALYRSGGVFAPDTTAKLITSELRLSPAAAYLNSFGDMTVAVGLVFAGKAAGDDNTHIDVAAWGSAGAIKYGVGVLMPDVDGVDPIIQATLTAGMGMMSAGASIQKGGLGRDNDDMQVVIPVNFSLGDGMYAGVGASLTMFDADGKDDTTDIGAIFGKKFAEGKFDTYLAVKSCDGDSTDVAIGITAAF